MDERVDIPVPAFQPPKPRLGVLTSGSGLTAPSGAGCPGLLGPILVVGQRRSDAEG